MERHVEQTELPLSRPRVPLLERLGGPQDKLRPKMEHDFGNRTLASPERIDDALLRNRVALLGDGFKVGEPRIYSPWSIERPPMEGYWNVTDSKTGTLNTRWWWDGLVWCKGDPRDKAHPRLRHEQFVTQFAWRGLLEVPQEAYEVPPYSLAAVTQIPGAGITGRYVKRVRIPMQA